MDNCLFCAICNKTVDSMILYEDDVLIAIRDISPQAPFHILIIPKEHIDSAAELTEAHGPMLAAVHMLAAKLCAQEGYTNGYRVVTNIGPDGAQTVQHLHFHILAGRQLGWPPG
ncbi:MAG: histidine triad nucleotide-binding protein [Ruminococcaceae bacterium]|nr:histidine triad nucleotide-binding protein [Oscillospiraceae bacterium]